MNTNIEQVKNVLAALGIQLADNVVLNDNVLCIKEEVSSDSNYLVTKLKENKYSIVQNALEDIDFDEIEKVFYKMNYTYAVNPNEHVPKTEELKKTLEQLCNTAIESIINSISSYQIEELKEILNADVGMLACSETGRFRAEARLYYYSAGDFELIVDAMFVPEQSDYSSYYSIN